MWRLSGTLAAGFDNGEKLAHVCKIDVTIWICRIEGVNADDMVFDIMGDDAFNEDAIGMDDDEVAAIDVQS